ncbi:MAG TPA: 3-methyl-2-oxobutanoate hydroxymethyltransferase, partial [Polyangiaceae bacterium LLY-WYZ-15_(1-7)]|nr:3-methyl-2-oxobutanoate hydroxymethyltransferase [Polyangiaceae bacterium LLY-WYZ-15_(1-7)]
AEAGAYAIVLEGVPTDLAARVTEALPIPTIGIGAGPHCDGQVLVCYDLLGLTPDLKPKFVKRYAEWFEAGKAAMARYRDEVREGSFPSADHAFGNVKKKTGAPATNRPAPRPRSPEPAAAVAASAASAPRFGGYGPQA